MFQVLAGIGVGSAVFQRALAADAEKATTVTVEMIQQAEWISGIKLTDEDRKALVSGLNAAQSDFFTLRALKVGNEVAPALSFIPAPWMPPADNTVRGTVEPTSLAPGKKPDSPDDLAFLPLTALSALLSHSPDFIHGADEALPRTTQKI